MWDVWHSFLYILNRMKNPNGPKKKKKNSYGPQKVQPVTTSHIHHPHNLDETKFYQLGFTPGTFVPHLIQRLRYIVLLLA
jgi:hypothetical protein